MRAALLKAAKATLKLVLGVVLFLVMLALAYAGWMWWDTRALRAFCEAVTPGISLQQLTAIAAQHGVDAHWVHGPGVFDQGQRDWVMFVPATSSMGEVVCEIRDDQQMVTSARMSSVDKQ